MASSMLPPVTGEKAMRDIKKAAVIQPGQVHGSTESLEQQQQAPKMLPVKCLSSFRGKITVSNWRAKQASDSQPYFTMQSGSSKNQVIGYTKALLILCTDSPIVICKPGIVHKYSLDGVWKGCGTIKNILTLDALIVLTKIKSLSCFIFALVIIIKRK